MGGQTGVRAVTVRRGDVDALRDVTLLAGPGELVVVLGASGSGKSTLLRTVAGLLPVASGEVVIDGEPATGLGPGQRRVSMVFETGALIPFLDVATNLGWGLRARHVPQPEVDRRVEGRARQFRIGRLLRRRPDQLSEGERGLVGIGRALVQTPRAFLLDEPLAHLDAAERIRVRRRIVEVVRSLDVTTLYVTHDPDEALAVADRVALLHEGTVLQDGPPRSLYDRPVSLLAAASVAPIGLVPARLVVTDGLAGYRVGRRTLPLWGPAPSDVDGPLVLGWRPEDVRPGDGQTDGVALDAVVTAVEYTGRHQAVTLAVGAPPVTAPGAGLAAAGGATLRALYPPGDAVRAGDAVRVTVDARRALVFDGITGAALHHP
ncbi:MAG TPA: ABC transporter ATP-binding protein [Mycobacteriales bacterium]|nr:ABC transporter ATP-binding protein [Mycobacteriales bacterium]